MTNLELMQKRCEELEQALRGLSDMYANTWDRVDGALMMPPEGGERFEAAHKAARKALGIELLEIGVDGELIPEHSTAESRSDVAMPVHLSAGLEKNGESNGYDDVARAAILEQLRVEVHAAAQLFGLPFRRLLGINASGEQG